MPVVTYSLLRLGLFALALLGLWLAGMGSWLLVVVAAVAAAALSYVILGKQRAAATTWMADRRSPGSPRISRAVQDDEAAEDAIADQLHDQRPQGAAPGEGRTDADNGDQTDADSRDQADADSGDQTASPSPSSTP